MELSCKEEVDISDLELEPENEIDDFKDIDEKPKIKKRRRREVDMIKLSDDEDDESDEENVGKKILMSPGHNSPASHREPRTCVLKASQKRRPLSRLLEQLLRNLEKRDPHHFFAWPVNDNFAPNYSKIIKRPMDFSTMKQKIDDNEYKSLNCFISDFKLMCNNALKYNKLGTVYHKAARRLLHSGLKQLTPQKLRPLAAMLTYMYEIPLRELGFDIGKMDVHKILKLRSPNSPSEAEQTSEGGDAAARGAGGDRVKIQMELAREQHRRRLAKQAFPRMDRDGKTTLCLAVNAADGAGEEKQMTLGQYIGKLSQGTGTLHTLREDRRNFVRGIKPLHYGPFSSYAPAHDGTFASLTKEESHLLYHTLPSETGQGNEELLRFAPDSPWSVIYDMEAMFPDKKSELNLPDKNDEADISSMTVSVSELRSLSELGIDMDFLSEIEEDIAASQHDYGLSGALQQTGALISKLNAAQHERLSLPPPAHLSLVPRPSPAERQLARAAAAALRQLTARVTPQHVAPLPAVRRAMGVTLAHLDTPITVDDIELHDNSDLDSRSS